jgi:heterodisulfide reductase subunit D
VKNKMSNINNLKKEWGAVMSCMGCGDCGYAIRPAVERFLTCPVKEAKGEECFEINFSRGRMNILKSVLEGQIPLSKELAEFVYECSECGNCSEVCHMSQNPNIILPTSEWIDHVKVWEALRKDLVEAGFAPLERHEKIRDYMINEDMKNPYGEPLEKKYEWTEGITNLKETGDLTFYAGCTMPLRQPETLRNMMKIFAAAGKDIALFKDDWCCGSIGLRIGDNSSVMELIKHNVEGISKLGTKMLFTACAGCYRTIKKDYPDLLGEELPFEVKHITEILIEMLRNGEIPFKEATENEYVLTYHDPCHLGRHMGMYEIPRELISSIPGVKIVEMRRNRKNAWCCGAGGGVKSQYPDLAIEISKERIREATDTGAKILTTSCPFCIDNLRDAYEQSPKEIQEQIEVVDLIDFIASRLF